MMDKMKDKDNPVFTTDDLHAYVDKKLSPERKNQVEAYLASHPKAAAEIADYQKINSAIYETFDDGFDTPVSSAQISLARDWHPRRRLIPVMTAAAGLLLGIGLGWFSRDLNNSDRPYLEQLAQRSSAAYVVYSPEKQHPVEVSGSDASYLSSWLSTRMDMSFRIPKLGDLGFELIGGRLMIGETSPAAMLMYENKEGRRIVLYVRNDIPPTKATKMLYARTAKTGVVTWAGGTVGFGLAGGFTENELKSAAQVVRAQFS